jgi:hypothetical protein
MTAIVYPVLVRLIVWGHTTLQAHRAADEAWWLADRNGWTIVAITTVVGGKASEQLAEATRDVHGPRRYGHSTYDRVYALYDAPFSDPANLDALARWAARWRWE